MAEDVAAMKTQCVNEQRRVVGHLRNGFAGRAVRQPDSSVIEERQLTVSRQRVEDLRVIAVKIPAEVLDKH